MTEKTLFDLQADRDRAWTEYAQTGRISAWRAYSEAYQALLNRVLLEDQLAKYPPTAPEK